MAIERKFRKVTLNLFDEDCVKLERWYGHGWTAEVRKRINDFTRQRAEMSKTITRHEYECSPMIDLMTDQKLNKER